MRSKTVLMSTEQLHLYFYFPLVHKPHPLVAPLPPLPPTPIVVLATVDWVVTPDVETDAVDWAPNRESPLMPPSPGLDVNPPARVGREGAAADWANDELLAAMEERVDTPPGIKECWGHGNTNIETLYHMDIDLSPREN